MPKGRPDTSGYARLAAAEEEEDPLDALEDEDPYQEQPPLSTTYASIQPARQTGMRMSGQSTPTSRNRRGGRPRRSNSGVDSKAINARLERWAEEIAQKFKIRKKDKTAQDEQPEIHYSVFQAPDWIRPATAETLQSEYKDAPGTRLSKLEFDDITESVRVAIELDMHPKLVTQGSSGSYFARNTDGKVVGIFKPKDEEPYGQKNPKWIKWAHRNLFPFFFGRACLIPNLSYVSEAASYILDTQLRTNLVPYTDVVNLSSKSFFYDYWDRRRYYRKKLPLPEKPGSFQVFLKGFKDANKFLKAHPWPDHHNQSFRDTAPRKKKRRRWTQDCRPSSSYDSDEDDDGSNATLNDEEARHNRVFWTDALQSSFREQLEKLVILDYIMRNTDRGLDNWMIRIDRDKEEATIVIDPPKTNGHAKEDAEPYKRNEQMSASGDSSDHKSLPHPVAHVGAIDNSLAWPWKHPDAVSLTLARFNCVSLIDYSGAVIPSAGSSSPSHSSANPSPKPRAIIFSLSSPARSGGWTPTPSSVNASKKTPISKSACSPNRSKS